MKNSQQRKWWGWGTEASSQPDLPPHGRDFLANELDGELTERTPVTLAAVKLPDAQLADSCRERLVRVVGSDHVRDDKRTRVERAAGKGYADLARLRVGNCEHAPDAVIFPGNHGQLAEVLQVCAAERVAVVPFGGGTSVVGGVKPLRGHCAAVIALDLSRLAALRSVDRESLIVTAEAGFTLPALESELAQQGLTLGHFPQSFEQATLGGCVATRSAGQASAGYGRIDDMVVGLRCATPTGELTLPALPPNAAGPDLRELLMGSEGTLGVITEATVIVRPQPAVKQYEGWFFHSFAEGAACFRTIAQCGAAPTVARLSDGTETRVTFAQADRNLKQRLGESYLRLRGYNSGCLAIIGWEGTARAVRRARTRTRALLHAGGGISLGAGAGRAWQHGRFQAPYFRDTLLDHGVMVETLETATTWSGLADLHAKVEQALTEALSKYGTKPLVWGHISHIYRMGASLYFTFIARQDQEREVEQWYVAKQAACAAIVAAGGTITHHHAIGHDHLPWLGHEIGPRGNSALQAVKAELDPHGIMNPGKLIAVNS